LVNGIFTIFPNPRGHEIRTSWPGRPAMTLAHGADRREMIP
jgi:hypothetical protein